MREVFEWVSSLDLAVIYTAVIGLATTWGGSIVALVIAVIKLKIKNFNVQNALAELKIEVNENQNKLISEFKADVLKELDNISNRLITKEDEHALERMKAIQQLTDDVDTANKELQKAFDTAYDAAKELN